jgi:hypothetical protein
VSAHSAQARAREWGEARRGRGGLGGAGGVTSGSGYLVVVPIDALGDGGHFGGDMVTIG